MDNKNEIFDDIEIIDDSDFVEEVNNIPAPINTDWLSDFTNVEKPQEQHNAPVNVESDPIIIEEEIINNDDIVEEAVINPNMEVLNNAELTDPTKTNYQLDLKEQEERAIIEEELNNNRSVMFIVVLFGILIIFVILLPYINKILK